jgi:hypothetical protein
MENVSLFFDHLEYLNAIWYILWLYLVYFPVLVCSNQDKSGNPEVEHKKTDLSHS